jgi:hypothetical protein
VMYHRLRIPCPLHAGCQKFRNTSANQRLDMGALGPVAYLAVWAKCASEFDRDTHKLHFKPSLDQMHEWIESQKSHVLAPSLREHAKGGVVEGLRGPSGGPGQCLSASYI